ncbi:hypothetical protein NMY22_g2584 [Coprinellus aureogranulatus]|nr:hypothetical protein NMY22_g2584 [Coprinellus aureogranulatus]
MQFMHKQRFPSLQNETVDGLLRLGEAAEKYVVHSAMLACALRIRDVADKNPNKAIECLKYAAKFDYSEVADAAAPYTIAVTPCDMRQNIGGYSAKWLIAWMLYRELS